MFDRSAAVKLQLRDAKGRFIKMGSHVKWTSLSSGKNVSGIVRGEDGNNVIIEFQHGGKPYTIHVPHTKLDVINQKATLDAAYVQKMGGHVDTPNINDPGVTPGHAAVPSAHAAPATPIKNFAVLNTNETTYKVGSADGEKILTKASDLQLGDQVFPTAKAGTFQKSPYNSKDNSAATLIQKFGPGIGTVTKIDPKGNWVVISDDSNPPKTHAISTNHFVFKRDHNTERAVLNAQETEAKTIYAGKTPPALWMDSLKGDKAPAAKAPEADEPNIPDEPDEDLSDHVDVEDMPVGATLKAPYSGDNDIRTFTKIGEGKWKVEGKAVHLNDGQVRTHLTGEHAPIIDKADDAPKFKVTTNNNFSSGSVRIDSADGKKILTDVGTLKVGDKVLPIGSPSKPYGEHGNYSQKTAFVNTQHPSGTGTVLANDPNVPYVHIRGEDDQNYFPTKNFVALKATPELEGQIKEITDAHSGKKPDAVPAADSPLGDNFSELPAMSEYQKGDVVVLKDGSLAAWIGKGQLELEDGSKIKGNKFSVDGAPQVLAGKDIAKSYRPIKNVVTGPADGPFGEGFHSYSFDLSKPNNENFKSGDFVVYGKEKNLGKIFSVNPTNILVEKMNSDKNIHGTATIVAGQVHGKYIKDKSSTSEPAPKLDSIDPAEDLTPAETQEIADSNAQKIAKLAENVDFTIHPDSAIFWQKDGNPLVSAALEEMGVAKNKPTLVSDEEFAKLKADGHHIIYRGISGTVEGTTPVKAQQDILTSDSPKIGNGLYGGGTYFTNNPDTAKQYGHSGGAVSTYALTPDAKMVNMEDITKIRDEIKAELGDKATPKVQEALKDLGFVAVMSGFDGIFVPGGNGSDNGASNFYTMLNRGTMAHTENNIVASNDLKVTMADMPWGNKKETTFGKAVPTGKPAPENPEMVAGEPAPSTPKGKPSALKKTAEAPAEAPAEPSAPADAPTAPEAAPEPAAAPAEATPATDPTTLTYPDKGKSITDATGATVKANDMVHFPGKGVGKVMIVLPSTDSVRVVYPDGVEKVHKFNKITKVEGDAPKIDALPADLKVGDSGIDPETHTAFIVGKNNTLIHKGDTVTHSSGDKGVVTAIYKGEKTVKVQWADGHSTGPKKSSTLEAETKAPAAPQAAPDAPQEVVPKASARPYNEQDEKALVDFKDNFMEIGEHLRGSAEHAFPNAGEIIHGLDELIAKSQLKEDLTTYRGFVTLDPKVVSGLVPGKIMYEKSFTSTSLDPNIALDSLDLGPLVEAPKNHAPGMAPPEVEHSVIIKFELPKGSYGHQINYDGLNNKQYKQDSHEQEVILPRAYNYEIKEVADGTDAQGRPLKTVTVTAVHKDGASDQNGPGMHAVEANAKVGSKPFKILEDPGADGDGFHESGPWGHFGASGVMVEAPDPETGEPRYLIVENGDLHEEQNRGLWQLPGGAANGNENPYQAAAREMHEELEVDPAIINEFEHAGDVAFENGKGWAYTNIGAKSSKQFDMKLDGYETSGAKWVSADELRQMRDNNELLPAFGANVDNLLAVYTPKDDAKAPEANAPEADAPDAAPEALDLAAKPLNINDFTKIHGKYSGGSNDGAFYTDKDGTEYYLKYNMAEGHARDEILASKIYQSLGVNAANQEMLDMGNGKIGVASKMIATDGHGSNIHLDEPEYRKEAQKDFAIDALLANWDVAGIGNNNLLTDANGKPLRLDPGAALRFRAQGAPKSDFGPSAKEWDFLRTGANSESSSIKPTAKLFGDMTDEQLKESASKLHELTDDKIDSIVESVGYDKKDGDFLKATLKARRDDILERAGVKDTNNEGAHDGAGQAAGDGTTHEAGPEDGSEVPLDSGSGTDLHAADESGAGEVQHRVGDEVKGTALGELPVGTQIEKSVGAAIGLTKTSPTEWTKTDKSDLHPFQEGFLTKHYDDKHFKIVALPESAQKEAPKDLQSTPLQDLEVGTKINVPTGSWYFKKADDGEWHAFKKDTHKESLSKYNDKDMTDFLKGPATNKYTVEAPEAEAPKAAKPDWDGKTFAEFGKDKVNDLPVGTKMHKGAHYFEKRPSGKWQGHTSSGSELSNKLATPEQMMGMPDHHAQNYVLEAPSEPGTGDLKSKSLASMEPGTIIEPKTGSSYYIKTDDGLWHTKDKATHQSKNVTISSMLQEDLKNDKDSYDVKAPGSELPSPTPAEDLPGKPIAEYTKEDISEMAVGSKVFRKNGMYMEKHDDNLWYFKKADGTKYFTHDMDDQDVALMMENHEDKFSHVEAIKGPESATDSSSLPATLKAPSEDDLAALPEGTVLTEDQMPGYKWVKKGDEWSAHTPSGNNHTLEHSSLADGSTYNVNPESAATPSEDALLEAPSIDELKALPDGTILTQDDMPGYSWTKKGAMWKAETPYSSEQKLPHSSMADGTTYNMVKPAGAPDAPAAAPDAAAVPAAPVKAGDDVKPEVLLDVPVGTVFHGVGSSDWEFKKISDTQAVFTSHPNGTKYDIKNIVDSAKGTDLKYTIASIPGSTPASSSAPAAPSGPSVKGKDGKEIFVGDQIMWQTKGILGKAIEIDPASNRVRMLYPDGSMKWYVASKMVKQSGTAPKPVKAPVKEAGDPSSPLYGTPAPTYEAPETALEPVPSYMPDGFIEEIEKRYADKINPSWSKPTPQQSYYWSKVEDFKDTGNLAALETLHEKLYISDEMFQKAKDHSATSAANIGAIKAANAKVTSEALKAHSAALAEWEAANGVVRGKNAITATFPKQATAEWDKASGFITNADGSVSADWSKAPAGSYSVEDILSSLEDENLAAHGISAMIDSTSIMDSNVRFTKVTMPDGSTRVQAKFEVSEHSRQSVIDAMNDIGAKQQSKVNIGYTEYSGVGDLAKYDPKVGNVKGMSDPSNYYGNTYTKDHDGITLQFTAGEENKSYGEFSNNAEALRSMAFVTLPENATTADLEKALKAMGIADAHPSPAESVDFHKMKRLVSFFDGFVGERNTKFEKDPQSLKLAAEKILAEKGYSLEDFRLVMTENGFMNFRIPNALRDELTKESGIKALIHTNMDWIPQGEKKGEFSLYQWKAGTHNVDRIIKKFAGGQKGYLPTAKRMLEGDNAKGMSPLPDIKSGGSRYLFMSPAKSQSSINSYSNAESGVVAHPSIAFQYLTNYGNAEDNMSGLREEGTTLMEQMSQKMTPNEAMIYNGLSLSDVWYSITNKEQKPTIVKELKARGVHEVNGIPVEEFFVIPGIDKIPEWKESNPELGE